MGLTKVSAKDGLVNKKVASLIGQRALYSKMGELKLYDDRSIKLFNMDNIFSPFEYLCYAAKKNTYIIGPDLSIYKCTTHFELEENKIGYITSNGTENIDEYCHDSWIVHHGFRDICQKCFLLPLCFGGGCPYKRNIHNERENSICAIAEWKKEIGTIIKSIIDPTKIDIIVFS